MNYRLELNKDKSIGNVLFIVEGNKTEMDMIGHIFGALLNYECEKLDRKGKYYRYQNKTNPYSRVFVINTEKTNISNIRDGQEYLDNIYEELINEYHFPVDRSAIYYIFDRDPRSNRESDVIKELLGELTNARDNEESYVQGLLLLSYPAIEAFILSNFNDVQQLKFGLGKALKQYMHEQKVDGYKRIQEQNLLIAVDQMHNSMGSLGIADYDIDRLGKINVEIFEAQEAVYRKQQEYNLLSLFGIALIDLGIVSFDKEV